MSAPLREQLQMARINRTKRRVHAWWHTNRCPSCMARSAGLSAAAVPVDGLAQVLQQLGVSRVEILGEDEADGMPATPPNQAH